MATPSNLIHVCSDEHFAKEKRRACKQLAVLDFTAKWCGPCQSIAPYFEDISEEYKNVLFFKIDVDQCQQTAVSYGVTSMPTFLFIWKEKVVDQLRGADPSALENMICKWAKIADTEQKVENIDVGRKMTCFSELLKNSKEQFESASKLLVRFADNVLKDKSNEKYRSIRLENKIFQERILPFSGAVQCLFEMGFQEQDDKLVLPMESPLDSMQALRDALLDEREKVNIENAPVDHFAPVLAASDPLKNFNPVIRTPKEREFYQRLKSSAQHVFVYEEPDMMRYCLEKIPIVKLRQKAKERSEATTVGEKDCLLLLLLEWFKLEFFTWTNEPKCSLCNVATQCIGRVPPNEDQRRWGAGNVENYVCRQCNRNCTFPRYNHPQKLLETRTGRCGEWANCFSACCRAVGFETRYVLDWTDHVWTEVYSEHQKRWLHCDPCENVCDKPLLYEAGWGKKLTYVIAFSNHEVIDVTWRYSVNHNDILSKRNEVDETWLVSLWMEMTKELQSTNTEETNRELEKRRISELVEFLERKTVTNEEKIGRQSGSIAWRMIRGEAGSNMTVTQNPDNPSVNGPQSDDYIFTPTLSELEQGSLRVRYCAATDMYTRDDAAHSKELSSLQGWVTGTASTSGIFRKVEHDWKMAYLAREQGATKGTVSWKFKVDNDCHVVDEITIKASSTTFENGVVEWSVDNGTVKESIPHGDSFKSAAFSGSTEITLAVILKGGKGDVAWQHAQLFRQKLDDVTTCGLDIIISYRKR